MFGYKCVNCGATKEYGSKVYFVSSCESIISEPTCSKECAESKNKRSIKILEDKISALKNEIPLEEVWEGIL